MIPISQDQQTELAPNHILMHRVSRQENDGTTIYEPLARVMLSRRCSNEQLDGS